MDQKTANPGRSRSSRGSRDPWSHQAAAGPHGSRGHRPSWPRGCSAPPARSPATAETCTLKTEGTDFSHEKWRKLLDFVAKTHEKIMWTQWCPSDFPLFSLVLPEANPMNGWEADVFFDHFRRNQVKAKTKGVFATNEAGKLTRLSSKWDTLENKSRSTSVAIFFRVNFLSMDCLKWTCTVFGTSVEGTKCG